MIQLITFYNLPLITVSVRAIFVTKTKTKTIAICKTKTI